MRAFPIVQRELTVARRNPVVLATRSRVTGWGVGLAMVGLLMDWAGLPVLRWSGPILLAFIALLMTERALSQGFELIVEERRSGTFDLLRLAGVGPLEFTLGKAAGAIWLVGMQAMGLIPLLALPFLSGGLSAETFLGMVVFLPGVLPAAVGVSLLGAALAWTWFLVLAWTLGPLVVQVLGRITLGRSPLPDEWMALSPVHVAALLPSGLTRGTSPIFWMGWLLMVGVGMACLVGAGLCLAWRWRREREETRPLRVGARRHPGEESVWLARPLEEVLAGVTWRLRVPTLALGGFALAWLLAAVAWGRPRLASVLSLAFLLLLALASSLLDTTLLTLRVARDRREGAFEELLTSPLIAEQVVEGYVRDTHRLMRRFLSAPGRPGRSSTTRCSGARCWFGRRCRDRRVRTGPFAWRSSPGGRGRPFSGAGEGW